MGLQVPTVKNFDLKHGSIKGFFKEHDADIVCFQETKLTRDKLTKELACVDQFESFWAFSEKKLGYSGVATYVGEAWSPIAAEIDSLGVLDTDLNGEGRVIVTDHDSFVLINVYVPNAGMRKDEISLRGDLKIRFLHALKAKCDAFRAEGKEVILVGDLNIAASQQDVHPSFSYQGMYHPEELSIMSSILKEYTDVWRHQNPGVSDAYSCWDEKTFARSVNKGVRIDYVLVSPGLLPKVGICKILDTPSKWSDHAALLISIKGVHQPAPHNPIASSSRRMKEFNTRSQPTIASMFARKTSGLFKPAAQQEAETSKTGDLTLGEHGRAQRVDEQGEEISAAVDVLNVGESATTATLSSY